MGRSERRKGAEFEVVVAKMFKAIFPNLDIRRSLSQARNAGEEPDVAGTPGFWVEAKARHYCVPRRALEQAAAVAPADRIPLAVCKDDRKPVTVTLFWSDFAWLLKRWLAGQPFPQDAIGRESSAAATVEEKPQLELRPPAERDAWGNP